MGSLFSFVRDMCRKGSGYMDAKDFMKSYEEHIKNVKGGNIKMKELFNPEEKNNEEMKSMDLFSKATNAKEKRVPDFSAEANTSEKIEEEEDNGEKGDSHTDSLAQELFQQEVNFSKTGTVNSAAEELELPDNMDMTALEDELQRVVQWQSSKHSVKRSVRGKRKNLIVKLTMTDSETDLAKIVQMQS